MRKCCTKRINKLLASLDFFYIAETNQIMLQRRCDEKETKLFNYSSMTKEERYNLLTLSHSAYCAIISHLCFKKVLITLRKHPESISSALVLGETRACSNHKAYSSSCRTYVSFSHTHIQSHRGTDRQTDRRYYHANSRLY